MEARKNSAYGNSGNHGESLVQIIHSSSSSNSLPNNFYGVDQYRDGHEAIQMNVQYATPTGQQVYVVPEGQNFTPQPKDQNMVRDTSTPMPLDQEYNGPVIQPLIGLTIFKRVISALFIILDVCLNWLQFASWVGTAELPEWLNFLEIANSLKSSSPIKSQCSEGSDTLTTVYGVIAGIATMYALVRIINMFGETLLEYQKQYPSDKEPSVRGFQIQHGWLETLLAMVCDDIPQIILLLFFSINCTLDLTVMVKVLLWMLFKEIKNGFRIATCKHIYKPACKCDCTCCEYEWDFICCCTVVYFRVCPGSKPCCETKKYDICPDLPCARSRRCCGEYEKDPHWAKNLYIKFGELFSLLLVAIAAISVLKHLDVMS